MGARETVQDWKYLISKNNQKSRGFYLSLTVFFVFLLLATLLAFVAAALGLISGTVRIVSFAALPVAIVFIIGIIALLNKFT